MRVITKKDGQDKFQGIYGVFQTLNGRPSWKSASKAIWYIQEFNDWAIGELNDIGTWTRDIASFGDQGDKSPFQIPNTRWEYVANELNVGHSDDISLQCNVRQKHMFDSAWEPTFIHTMRIIR